MERADDMFCLGVERLGAQIAARLGQMVGAFTEQRYRQVSFGGRGELSLGEAATGRMVPFLMLAPADKDVAFLALKFALLEARAKSSPLPIVLDDPFVVMPELKHPLALKMLKYMGSVTQVLHLTATASFAAQADTRIDL